MRHAPTESSSQQMDGADSAMGDAVDTISQIVMNVAGGEHGLLESAEIALVQAAFDAPLAVG